MHIPDAKKLMLAGGVEVMQITVQPQRGIILQGAQTWAFVRSPADVFFYSGHGLNGNLVTHGGGEAGAHDQWMTSTELLQAWTTPSLAGRNQFDMDVLIINGCSVLNCDSQFSDGMKWARLLSTREGILWALLGYRAGTPLDTGGGHAVSAAFARRIAGSLFYNQYARAWLEVNRSLLKTFPKGNTGYTLANACAIDHAGYWTLSESNDIVTRPLAPVIPILGGQRM